MNTLQQDATDDELHEVIEQYDQLLNNALPNGKKLPVRLQRALDEQTRRFRNFGFNVDGLTMRDRIDGISAAMHAILDSVAHTDEGETISD